MNRIEIVPKPPIIVPREAFDKDWQFGYVALEYNPERTVTHRDHRSGRELRRVKLPDIVYRCVECQFDSFDEKTIQEHRAIGNHIWAYGMFKNPYGHASEVMIEGIEDYNEYLSEKSKSQGA